MKNKTIISTIILAVSILITGEFIIQPILQNNIDLKDEITQLEADKIGIMQELIETKVSLRTELTERNAYVAEVHRDLDSYIEQDKESLARLSEVEYILSDKELVIINKETYNMIK